MRVNRGNRTDTTAGDRKIIFCEGEKESVDVIFYKTILGINAYDKVQVKIREIKQQYIENWKNEFDALSIDCLPAKEIFKELKNKIFINPPKESDIAKDIAIKMFEDNFLPEDLKDIFKCPPAPKGGV